MIRYLLSLTVLLAALLPSSAASAQESPRFVLGFGLLAEQIPGVVGSPLENEQHGANGDALQRTTRGLMVWRRADNWTAFTDGSRSWVSGPNGVQERSNDQRFPWEYDDRNAAAGALPSAPSPPVSAPPATAEPPRGYPRINLHPSSSEIDWARAPVFWFGGATEQDGYVDIRAAYDSRQLYLSATVVDYHLWFDQTGAVDPRQYDAIALYLSTSGSGNLPSPNDYLFIGGYQNRWPPGSDPQWQRQARRGGAGWDYGWSPAAPWTSSPGARWYDSGPNDNADRDAGWASILTIPWAALALSGPPPSGSELRLGLKLYDRDAPPPAAIATQSWPPSFDEGVPGSWGVVVLDPPAYHPASGTPAGTTVIRRGLNGAVVLDGYVGGGGLCAGGIFGDGERAHPTTEQLFVQNQSDVADFPCFSRSYLSFDLSGVPAGKKILGAKLRLYQFGGSDPTQARPSMVQMFTVEERWDEKTLTWNGAPLARENVSSAVVPVIPGFPGWPGVPIEWDATQAVAEAYSAGRAAGIALYSADTAYHSGKYFTSSNAGEWNALGRPTLTVTWGE